MNTATAPLSISRRTSASSHRRGSSQSSQVSSPSMGTMSEMLQALSSSPKSGKMAEDAKRAMAMAHGRRARPPGVLQMPAPLAEVPSQQTTPMPAPPRPSRPSSPTPSDRMWSRLESNDAQSPYVEADAFEFDHYIQEPAGEPAWVNSPPPAAVPPAPNPAPYVRIEHFAGVAPQQNALAIFWRGDRPQTFALVTDAVGEQDTDETYPIEVEARHTQVLEMPDQWSGRVQRVTGLIDEPATRCAIEFGGYRGLTFFGVSYAFGNNGPVVICGEQTSLQSGCAWRAEQMAPNAICHNAQDGTRVIHGTTTGPRNRRLAVHKFYRDFLEHPSQGAVELGDDEAIQATRDRHLLLDFH